MIILSIYGIRSYYKSPKNENPRLILSDDGIVSNGSQVRKWSEIKNEDIIVKPSYSGRFGDYYLSYDHKNGSEKIFINELDISTQKLNYLLKIYRKRSDKNRKPLTLYITIQQHIKKHMEYKGHIFFTLLLAVI
ncbi:hypothetical protein [Aquimarina sp. MAR_2010_214]|uniref:hypothetical protein n=1 Tax=Aquimarina sp. MAR_2010_214 TaxID=1250026 RepID=UPI000C701349|nr:hypothetical protein [Aquimarina sp. MAR_2010_214]